MADVIVPNGANPDTRAPEERAKDLLADEVAAGTAIPFNNPKITTLSATVYDQWYTSSCVPHGFLTQLEYEGVIPPQGISQLRAYRKRVNYPQPGSQAVDMYMKIKSGQNFNTDAPVTPSMAEFTANAMPYVTGLQLLSDFTFFQYIDSAGNLKLDGVVPDIAVGKAVSVFIYASEDEWAREYVTVREPLLTPEQAYVRHCVCLIPKGDFTENTKQWLTVHDSAKFGGRHLRYMSNDFFLRRVRFAAKVYKNADTPPLPPTLLKPVVACKKGDNNNNVKVLQNYLAERRFLDPKYVTGLYGNLTAQGVLWWQLFHHDKFATNIPELLKLRGESFGPQSLKVVTLVP